MRIRYILRNIVERITRKSCDRCCHCIDGVFCDNYKRYSECTANIYPDGRIERKAKIPAIIKLLMAQTKDYKLPIEKTIVKSYILKKSKFRTDLHTHLNQILQPDLLIALGVKHQIGYSLYYIKKLNL